ncbi:MAG: hypothetical protein ACPL5I_16905 [Thermodesulfobacteriota bacterium]
MKIANIAEKAPYFTSFFPKIFLNSSSSASSWAPSVNFALPGEKEFLFTTIYLYHFDISITGFEDSLMKSAESLWRKASAPMPKTSLGQALLKIREKIVASGEPLLDWDDIEKEIATRRGKVE